MSSGGGTASSAGSGGSTVIGAQAPGSTGAGSTGAGSTGAGSTGAGTEAVDVGAPAPDPHSRERGSPLTQRLRVAAQRFLVPLRRNEGFDSDALDELCEAIDSCGRAWVQSPAVPKAAALILAELFPAIDGCARLYPDPMRQRIIEAAARVAQSVSASLDTPDGGLAPDL